MAQGSLYRSIARTGGLKSLIDPIIQSFQAIQDQNQRLAWLKNIQDTYKNYTDQLNQINNTTQPQTTQVPNPNYQPYNTSPQQQPIDIFNVGRNALTPPVDKNVNNEVPSEMVTRPTFDKTTNVPLSDVQKLNKAQGLANSTIMDLFTSPNSKYDSGQLNFLSRLIDQGTEQFRPGYTTKDIAAGAKLVKFDKYGNVVGSIDNPKAANTKVLDESLNDQGHKIVEYEDASGKRWTEDKGVDYKFIADQKRQATADARLAKAIEGKDNKKLTPSTAGDIAMLQNPELFKYKLDDTGKPFLAKVKSDGTYERDKDGNYILDPINGKEIPNSPEVQKYLQDKAINSVKLQTLTPRANEFIDGIEKRFGRRPNTKEWVDEIKKHRETLSEEDGKALKKYLQYISKLD